MRIYWAVTFLIAGLLWLAPIAAEPTGALFWRGGAYSDLLISHWPNAVFLRRSLVEWNQIPLWNPTILSGAPFAADPLSGLWYPPNWLAAILHPGMAFNLLLWLHIAWGGYGMWRFAISQGIGKRAALIAGLAFSGTPKLIGHMGLGHISLVFAVYWTPWVLLAIQAAVQALSAGTRRRLAAAALSGAGLGLVFLIDPRWFLPLLLLSVAYAAWQVAHSHIPTDANTEGKGTREGGPIEVSISAPAVPDHRPEKAHTGVPLGRMISSSLVAGMLAVAIAASLALPLSEFISLSTRAELTQAEAVELALPIPELTGLLAPSYGGWPEWQVYAGAVVLFLALAAILGRAADRWLWTGVVAVSVLIAIGDATPAYRILSGLLPGFGQLRVPPRSLFASAFALSLLAGAGVQQILDGAIARNPLRSIGVGLVGVLLVLGAATWAGGDRTDQELLRLVSYGVAAVLVGIATFWAGVSPTRTAAWITGWIILIIVDLGLVNVSTLEARPIEQVDLTSLVSADRVFSPSYSVPQPAAAELGIELADGVNPLQLASYRDFMALATGFGIGSYSVTLPPFLDGGPAQRWGFEPDLKMLGYLGVSQIISAYPIEAPQLEFEGRIDGQYHYRNPLSQPRAWIDGAGSIARVEWSPNQIQISAAGPGQLILGEVAYPGWQVSIDGEPSTLETYKGVLRGVQVPAGEHEILFAFRSAPLNYGILSGLLGLIVLGSLWLRK